MVLMVLLPLKWVHRTRARSHLWGGGGGLPSLFKWDRFRPGSHSGLMDGTRLSDFSIERILGLGRTEPQQHHGPADPGPPRGPPPLLIQFGLGFAEPCFRYFYGPDLSCACSTSGLHLHVLEAPGTRLSQTGSGSVLGSNFSVLARVWRRLL